MKRLKTALAMMSQVHRLPRMPSNDFGKEKQMGLAALGALMLLFGAVLVYRTQPLPDQEGESVDGQPLAAAPAGTTKPGAAIAGTGATSKTSGNVANATDSARSRFTPPATLPGNATLPSSKTPASLPTSAASLPTTPTNRYAAAGDDRYSKPASTPVTLAPTTTLNGTVMPTSENENSLRRNDPRVLPASGVTPLEPRTAAVSNSAVSNNAAPSNAVPTTTNPVPAAPATQPTQPGFNGQNPGGSFSNNHYGNTTNPGNPYRSGQASVSGNPLSPTPTQPGMTAQPGMTPPGMYAQPGPYSPPGNTQPGTTPPAAAPRYDRYGQPINPGQSQQPAFSQQPGVNNNPYGAPTQPGFANPQPNPRGPAAANLQAPPNIPPGARIYKVRDGDTLFDIARYELGKASRWSEIYKLNRDRLGDDLDYLPPGIELVLPPDPNALPAQTTPRAPLTTSREFPTAR